MSTQSDTSTQKLKEPSRSLFKQQALPSWTPVLRAHHVFIGFAVVGVIFVPLGIILRAAALSVDEVVVTYSTEACKPPVDDAGVMGTSYCTLEVQVPVDLKAPAYVYYQLTNYYQNHRRYVKSRSDAQLRGDPVLDADALTECAPRIGLEGLVSEDDEVYLPCGLVAWSRFNDSFLLRDGDGESVSLREDGIAWPSDVANKFKSPPEDTGGIHVIPLEEFTDEHFIVWMRTAGLPYFRKLYAVLDDGLAAGKYNLYINSSFPVHEFGGTKSFVISTASWIGGRNTFLGTAYLVVGVVALVISLVFLGLHIAKPRALGDPAYIPWASAGGAVRK